MKNREKQFETWLLANFDRNDLGDRVEYNVQPDQSRQYKLVVAALMLKAGWSAERVVAALGLK